LIRSRVREGAAAVRIEAGVQVNEKESVMLYIIAAVLVVLWLLGLVSSYTMGGLIHILLVLAIVVILLNFIGRRRAL
jgi:Family of unknown function (DUF5670)